MLLILDKKISAKIIKNLHKDLRYLGYKIFPLYVEGSKKIKIKNFFLK